MTTREEALEQGWQTPAPTFFGADAVRALGKCFFSPWVVVRETVPPTDEETGVPRARPFMYVPKAVFARG